MNDKQKGEVKYRVSLALSKLPPELRKGKRYAYARIVTRIVMGRDK